MVSSSSIIQELIPQLSASLGQLRRVPGRNDAWVPQVIAALEKEPDQRFERMRRRIGFAQRLGTIAEVSEHDGALVTLGLFFHELLPAKSNGARMGRAWREYLVRNEEWLRPAFEICEAIRQKNLADIEDAAEIVAKITVVYDGETMDRHERSLQVIESMIGEAEEHAAQRIVDLFWTEDGQELCDHHFRRHPRGYRLDAEEIRGCLAKLYRVTRHASVDFAIESMRLGSAPQRGRQETSDSDWYAPGRDKQQQSDGEWYAPKRQSEDQEVEQPMAQTEKQDGPLGNFDRRREALRTRTSEPEPRAGEASAPDQLRVEAAEQVDVPERSQPQSRDPDPIALKLEERMNQLATISPDGHTRGDALDVRDRLQQLRLQLGQIQQIAAQAELLLDGIAPQIDEFAARIADVEAVMERWGGRSRAAA